MYAEEETLELKTRRKKSLYNGELDLDMGEDDENNKRFFDTMFQDNKRSEHVIKELHLDSELERDENGMIVLTCLPTAYMTRDKWKRSK